MTSYNNRGSKNEPIEELYIAHAEREKIVEAFKLTSSEETIFIVVGILVDDNRMHIEFTFQSKEKAESYAKQLNEIKGTQGVFKYFVVPTTHLRGN